MKSLLPSLLVMLCVLPSPAWAAQGDLPIRTSGAYIGLGVGTNQVDLKNEPIEVSGSDVTLRLSGGYRFTPKFLPWDTSLAIEAAYVDLGEVTDTSLDSEFRLETSGLDLLVVGYLPLTRRWDLVGKAGLFLWDATLKADGVTRDDSTGADLNFAVGFAYQTPSAWSAQVEVQVIDMFDGVWSATASAIYQFK